MSTLKTYVTGAIYIGLAALCLLWPQISSALALALGLFMGLVLGNPFLSSTKSLTKRLLAIAVVGLGAGMDLSVVARVGADGILYTLGGICAALAIGLFCGKKLGVSSDTSILVTVGTAICGGSAIAALAPILKAKSHEISIALGIVFLLNSFALLIFPQIGLAFGLSQEQFGLWSALAIHDTSSVVGASLAYGERALEVGTTVKLARALWIVPVSFAFSMYIARSREKSTGTAASKTYPWFILGFLITAALYTWIPLLHAPLQFVSMASKRLLILTLFIIGSNIDRTLLKTMGFKPLAQGLILWLVMAIGSLLAILQNWIYV